VVNGIEREDKMKKIGDTNEGNVLLEANQDEYLMLVHLASALEGKPLDYVMMRENRTATFPDFYGVFGAIEAFALANYRINDLQALLDQFKNRIIRRDE
jgi:hypothetical protein